MKSTPPKVPSSIHRSSKFKFPLVVLASVVGLILLFEVGKQFEWTGFGVDNTTSRSVERNAQRQVVKIVTTTTPQSAKTLWDILSLFVVPTSLLLLGWWLQILQQQRSEQQAELEKKREEEQAAIERQREEKRIAFEKQREEKRTAEETARVERLARQEKEIVESNQREEAVKDFIDRISDLLIEKNLIAIATKVNAAELNQSGQDELPEETELTDLTNEQELLTAAKNVVQARTLSILRRLGDDAKRKAAVIKFLADSDVIEKVGLTLAKADLSGVELINTNLKGMGLRGANLTNTNLSNSNLEGADLSYAQLSGTKSVASNFSNAVLQGADLSGTILIDFNFRGANLKDAKLIKATLSGSDFQCANLMDADLSNAKLTNSDLSNADLSNTNFNYANLSKAKGLTENQLSQALFCQTQLPDEYQSLSNRDCEYLKELEVERRAIDQALLQRSPLDLLR